MTTSESIAIDSKHHERKHMQAGHRKSKTLAPTAGYYQHTQAIDRTAVNDACSAIGKHLANGKWEDAHDEITALRRAHDRIAPQLADLDPFIRLATLALECQDFGRAHRSIIDAQRVFEPDDRVSPVAVWELNIAQMAVSARNVNSLECAGVFTLGRLIQLSRGALFAIPNISAKAMSEIRDAVAMYRDELLDDDNRDRMNDPRRVHPDWRAWIREGVWA